jgi:Zn-dependent alcohol dehydrogenase
VLSGGITNGHGPAIETDQIEEGSTVVVCGAGCIGLSIIHRDLKRKANRIIVIDINATKKPGAGKSGATDFPKSG